LIPEEVDRAALKKNEEEIEGREDDNHCGSCMDDVFVDRLNAYSKKEDCYGTSNNGRGDSVEDLAEPPVVQRFGDVLERDVCKVPAGS